MEEIKCRPFEQWEVESAMREGLFLYLEAGNSGKRRAEMNQGEGGYCTLIRVREATVLYSE